MSGPEELGSGNLIEPWARFDHTQASSIIAVKLSYIHRRRERGVIAIYRYYSIQPGPAWYRLDLGRLADPAFNSVGLHGVDDRHRQLDLLNAAYPFLESYDVKDRSDRSPRRRLACHT